MAKTLPDVAPPILDLFRVCYQHNGRALDQGEAIQPGIQGKFHTRLEAEAARKSCQRWFNFIKTVEIVDGKERFHVRERDVVDVWIEHYIDGELQSTDRPTRVIPAAVPIMEQPRGMQFATMLHEMLCEDFANTADEAAAIMDRHTDYVAECAAGGTSLKSIRACATGLEAKEKECREKETEKPAAKRKPTEVKEREPLREQIRDPRPESSVADLATA